MLNAIYLTNFKPWRDTGSVKLASMSVFFGEKSSGNVLPLETKLVAARGKAPAQYPEHDDWQD